MDRRNFLKAFAGSVVLIGTPSLVLAQTPEAEDVLKAQARWEALPGRGDGMILVQAEVMAFESAAVADKHWLTIDTDGEFLGEDRGMDGVPWEAFFVRFDNPYTIVNVGFGLLDNVVYQLRWESIHYGGERDGYALFKTLMNRTSRVETQEELDLLLPLDEEVNAFIEDTDRHKLYLVD